MSTQGAVKVAHNYIGGEWTPSGGGRIASINPATGEVLGYIPDSTPAEVEEAINQTRRAWRESAWGWDAHRRFRALWDWAEAIARRRQDLATLLTQENGKPLAEAYAEIDAGIDSLRYYAGMARNVFGRTFQPAADNLGILLKEPVGVVGVITPWNWPVLLLLRDLAPALAAGNAAVVKPAEATGLITAALLEILHEVESFPKGVLALVTGRGSVVGPALVEAAGTDMIAFTGSTAVGIEVMQRAAKRVKKVALELGGKSPNIVFADADLPTAVATSCRSIFMTAGQVCVAGSRLLVEEAVYPEVLRLAQAFAQRLRVGNGLDPQTDMGPLISAEQLERVLGYIAVGRQEGVLVTGGYRLTGATYDRGYFVAPTVVSDLPAQSPVVQEEIFGPVLAVQRFRSEEEAIELANGTPYGLTAGIWTQNLRRALTVARAVQAGTVWINGYNRSYAEAESGGYRQSGIGRTRGLEGLMEFTETKHVNVTL